MTFMAVILFNFIHAKYGYEKLKKNFTLKRFIFKVKF